MIDFLAPDTPFPPTERARDDLGGLLAIGGGLTPERLLDAYRRGIFPWGTLDQQALWYSPDPRMVLFPQEFRRSHSLGKILRSGKFEVRFDTCFSGVIHACAEQSRAGQNGTWITPEIMDAYIRLHELGWAHSVETYVEGDLIGGLYGIAIGRMFYGESMFSRRSNASKIAFAHLIRHLTTHHFSMIDCQMRTNHLASLGGREIPRHDFLARLQQLTAGDARRGLWSSPDPAAEW